MLSGERRQRCRTVKNNKRSNQQKSNFSRAAHFFCTFLCRCFERPQRETSRNFLIGPVYMEWGTPVQWGWFLLYSRSGGHKTKETYPTRPGSPTPCKQGLSYTFNGGNVVRVLVHFFSLPLIFTLHWWPLAIPILSPPLQNFDVVLPVKNVSFVFYLSLQTFVALFLVVLRWPTAQFLFFSVFLLLYIPNLWT